MLRIGLAPTAGCSQYWPVARFWRALVAMCAVVCAFALPLDVAFYTSACDPPGVFAPTAPAPARCIAGTRKPCTRDTGVSCGIWPCAPALGGARCELIDQRHYLSCVCADGFCFFNGACTAEAEVAAMLARAAASRRAGAASCADEPSFENGFGFGCADYAARGWCAATQPPPPLHAHPWRLAIRLYIYPQCCVTLRCAGGRVGGGFEWTSGAKHNFPEARCCACGGGSIAGAAPSAAVRPSHAATQHDTVRRSAAALGLNALQAVAVMQQAVAGAQRACYDSEGWTNGHGLGCAEYSALRYARRCNVRCGRWGAGAHD